MLFYSGDVSDAAGRNFFAEDERYPDADDGHAAAGAECRQHDARRRRDQGAFTVSNHVIVSEAEQEKWVDKKAALNLGVN